MDRLGNVTSSPSQSRTRLSTPPFASNPSSRENPFNYWSYFVDLDPKIKTWQRVMAGAALPIAGPLALFGGAGCGGRPVAFGDSAPVDVAKLEGFTRIIESESYAGRLVVFFESPE